MWKDNFTKDQLARGQVFFVYKRKLQQFYLPGKTTSIRTL